MNYEIEVYGLDLENVESLGGWQLYLRTTNYAEAERVLDELLAELGWDNVTWNWEDSMVADKYTPDEEPSDIDSDFGYDPYMGCCTYDC